MMDVPLTVTALMRYGTSVFGDKEVVTCTAEGTRRQPYAAPGERGAGLGNGPGRPGAAGVLVRGSAGRGVILVRVARAGREVRGGNVLHQRHDRPAQGRRLQPPVHVPALDGCVPGSHVR